MARVLYGVHLVLGWSCLVQKGVLRVRAGCVGAGLAASGLLWGANLRWVQAGCGTRWWLELAAASLTPQPLIPQLLSRFCLDHTEWGRESILAPAHRPSSKGWGWSRRAGGSTVEGTLWPTG